MRYRVYPFSLSAHRCFEATVVDTNRPQLEGGKSYIGKQYTTNHNGVEYPLYDAVCECFEVEDAQRIANALNQTNVDYIFTNRNG